MSAIRDSAAPKSTPRSTSQTSPAVTRALNANPAQRLVLAAAI
jgi:hypothetical protein